MMAGIPVLAANEGGPTETVIDGQTGWLRDVRKVQDWTEVMRAALEDGPGEERLKEMGMRGQERVKAEFSKGKMAERFENEIQNMMYAGRVPMISMMVVVVGAGLLGVLIALAFYMVGKSRTIVYTQEQL